MMEKKKPIHEIRLGKVRAAIWQNDTDGDCVTYGVTFSRLYKDGEQWRDSSSFGRQELLLLRKVADLAHTFLHQQPEQVEE
jgi:hypothetical protein